MTIIESILLGGVQGATEFIPVSSSGHLEIVEVLLGGNALDFHMFLQFVNIGTLLALLIFYRKKLLDIGRKIVKGDWKLARNVLLTSIPAGLVGMLLADRIENSDILGSMWLVATMLGVVGMVMILVDKLPKMSAVKEGSKLSPKRALAIGVVQMFALIPGVSRSGSTILAGRVCGMDSKAAADYSFLASIPIMFGVMLKLVLSPANRAYFSDHALTIVISNIVALVAGLLAIKFVLTFLKREGNLQKFGWYRVAVAVLIFIFLV